MGATRGAPRARLSVLGRTLAVLVSLALLWGPAGEGPVVAGSSVPQRFVTARQVMAGLESAMLYQDAVLRYLQRDLRVARARLRAVDHRLARLERRLGHARERAARLLAGLEATRDLSSGEVMASPAAIGQATALDQTEDRRLTDSTPEPLLLDPLWAGPASRPMPSPAVTASPPPAGGPAPLGIEPPVVEAGQSLEQREARYRVRQRASHRLERRVRGIERVRRAHVRRLASLRWAMRTAHGRQSAYESALIWKIRNVTDLAQPRAASLSPVRPGSDGSGFALPSYGRISQRYGCTGFRLEPPRGSCPHFHSGVDIVAWSGSAVRASAVGVVAYVGWSPYGRLPRSFCVVVGHAGGFETFYGHLLAVRLVRIGQLVQRGQVIGYMGSTGRSTGPHVHWEVTRSFSTMDPLAFR